MLGVDVDPDLEAVRRAQGGDARAFEALVARHGRSIYAACRRFTHDAHEAEDLAQEAILRAYRGLGAFRAESSFRTWIFRIVMNVGRTWWARRRPEPPAAGPAAPAGDAELLESMRAEIATLPDRQREVLTLRVFAGLEFEEIAEILEISPGAARVHLSMARKALAEKLRLEDES
jgi:RNA polymerase sigma-70 factor (ECF subfamily)